MQSLRDNSPGGGGTSFPPTDEQKNILALFNTGAPLVVPVSYTHLTLPTILLV